MRAVKGKQTFRTALICCNQLLLIIGISIGLSACGGGSSSDPSPTPSPREFLPVHEPFAYKEFAHDFYNVNVMPDGSLVGSGILDASEISRLFIIDPGDNTATTLTPDKTGGGHYVHSTGIAVYMDNDVLYSKGQDAAVKLSGEDKVEKYWLSPDESKVLYLANWTNGYTVDLNTSSFKYFERNELYLVDITGGNRVKVSPDEPSKIAYESYTSDKVPHKINPVLLSDNSKVIYLAYIESSNQIQLHSINLDGSHRVVLNENILSDFIEDIDNANNTFAFAVSSDASKIIYAAQQGDFKYIS